MRYFLAAQGLTLVIVGVGMTLGGAYELTFGGRDTWPALGFTIVFAGLTAAGAAMARRNWPRQDPKQVSEESS